jgi:hypothetical protein
MHAAGAGALRFDLFLRDDDLIAWIDEVRVRALEAEPSVAVPP